MNWSHQGARPEGQARRSSALRSALSPILPFLEDDAVIEIMLNADGSVWVERAKAGMSRSQVLMSPEEAERMLRLIAAEMRLELNAGKPSLSAKLPAPWSARVQAAIPPIVEAPVFAVRKPARVVLSLEDYVAAGILTEEQRQALVRAVLERQNILVGGGTGSGKTTLANALLKVIAEQTDDRVLIIEDTPELQCVAENKVQVLVQPGVYGLQQAIMAAMRFRPDRILVGEVRDGSALELLKAWNTGHPGGIATIHANDTRAMLDRMCQLIEEVVHPAPRGLVAATVNLCVHVRRDPGSRAGRTVSGVERVAGVSAAGGWMMSRGP